VHSCVSVSAVQLGQNRLGGVLESGTVRVFEVQRIEQRGKADHQVKPGGAGGKRLEDVDITPPRGSSSEDQ
jgi:hypothetical protein